MKHKRNKEMEMREKQKRPEATHEQRGRTGMPKRRDQIKEEKRPKRARKERRKRMGQGAKSAKQRKKNGLGPEKKRKRK
jgi:hypothetical protein